MNFQEIQPYLLSGKVCKRESLPFAIKLGELQVSNPRKDRMEFNFPIVLHKSVQVNYGFHIQDLTAQDWVVVEEAEDK